LGEFKGFSIYNPKIKQSSKNKQEKISSGKTPTP